MISYRCVPKRSLNEPTLSHALHRHALVLACISLFGTVIFVQSTTAPFTSAAAIADGGMIQALVGSNVRSAPSALEKVLATIPAGATGKIRCNNAGQTCPVVDTFGIWWFVQWDLGAIPSGWSLGNYGTLQLLAPTVASVGAPAVTPTPTPSSTPTATPTPAPAPSPAPVRPLSSSPPAPMSSNPTPMPTPAPTAAPTPVSQNPVSSSGLKSGMSVRAVNNVRSRQAPGLQGISQGVIPAGAVGVIRCERTSQPCPTTSSGLLWWYVDWNSSSAPDGWSAESFGGTPLLVAAGSSVAIPPSMPIVPSSPSKPFAVSPKRLLGSAPSAVVPPAPTISSGAAGAAPSFSNARMTSQASMPSSTGQSATASNHLVGIEYEPWFPNPMPWSPRWGTPLLGTYDSSDPNVIRKHAEWLNAMRVDFILVDLSNNVAAPWSEAPNLERVDALFDVYGTMPKHPKIAILLGALNGQSDIDSGALARQLNLVKSHYLNNSARRSSFFEYQGKPLVVVYMNTPVTFPNGAPNFTDPSVTLRWMGGFLESQPNLIQNGKSKFGYWSWIDRDPIPADTGSGAEAVTVTSAYMGQTSWLSSDASGRKNGETFQTEWNKAVGFSPAIILINQWNEFTSAQNGSTVGQSDEYSPEFSNDLEPTQELNCGPANLVAQNIAAWKVASFQNLACNTNAPTDTGQALYPIHLRATLDGQPWSGSFSITYAFRAFVGQQSYSGTAPNVATGDYLEPSGHYSVSYPYDHSGPPGAIFQSITPLADFNSPVDSDTITFNFVSSSPTPVTSCADIHSGGTYVLSKDLVGPTPNPNVPSDTTCIKIHDTSNVNFDCAGHSITGNTPLSMENVQNFSLQACVVKVISGNAVRITGSTNGVVSGNNFTSGAVSAFNSSNLQVDGNTFGGGFTQSYSKNNKINNNTFHGAAATGGYGIYSEYGVGNSITNNTIDGRWTSPSVRREQSLDDGITLTDETRDAVMNNTIQNIWDVGIETIGVIIDSVISENAVSNAGVAGMGGWYWSSWQRNTVSQNHVGNTPFMFDFYRSYGLRPAGFDALHKMPADTAYYFSDNIFNGNTLNRAQIIPPSGPDISSYFSAGVINNAGTPFVPPPAPLPQPIPGERPVTPNDIAVRNNTFTGNDFRPGVPSFQPPTIAADGGGNICASPGLTSPIQCNSGTQSGTIFLRATLNGSPWLTSGTDIPVRISYTLPDGSGNKNFAAVIPSDNPSQPAGSYIISYVSGGPAGAQLQGINGTGNSFITQNLTANGTVTFTFNFVSSSPPAGQSSTLKATTALIGGLKNLYSPSLFNSGGVQKMALGGWLTDLDPTNYLNAIASGADPTKIVGADKIFMSTRSGASWSWPILAFQKIGYHVNDPSIVASPTVPGTLFMYYTALPNQFAANNNTRTTNNLVGFGTSNDDGNHWTISNPGSANPDTDPDIVMHQNDSGDGFGAWSPSAIVVGNEIWVYYHTGVQNFSQPINFRQKFNASGKQKIGNPERLQFPENISFNPGASVTLLINLDVEKQGSQYVMVANTTDQKNIVRFSSSDGLVWRRAEPTPIIIGGSNGVITPELEVVDASHYGVYFGYDTGAGSQSIHRWDFSLSSPVAKTTSSSEFASAHQVSFIRCSTSLVDSHPFGNETRVLNKRPLSRARFVL